MPLYDKGKRGFFNLLIKEVIKDEKTLYLKKPVVVF
jgi:hypothetical protein